VGKITASQFNLTSADRPAANEIDGSLGEPVPHAADPASDAKHTIDETLAEQAPEPLTCPECGVAFTSTDATFCPFDGARLQRAASVVHSDPLLGRVLAGRYQVLQRLGEGGMGAVYRVAHTTLGKMFAVKVLRAELARDAELSQRFIREARAMAQINNPYVIQVTDFGELDDGRPFFVMELLSGSSLSSLLKQKALSLSAVVLIVRRVAEALASAHAVGIIHRDLKPDNVHVEPDSLQVKVLDFGLAQVVGMSRLTRNGVVFGTPQYMSPEQASGAQMDHRADIYALGIVLYEMLAGRVPFEADSYMGVLTKQMYAAPAPLSAEVLTNVSLAGVTEPSLVVQDLEALVRRCLEKKAEERFASMGELIVALDDVLRRMPTAAAQMGSVIPGPFDRASHPPAVARSGARPWLWAGALGAFLFGMGLWGWYGSAPREQALPMARPAAEAPAPVAKRPAVRPIASAAPAAASAAPSPASAMTAEVSPLPPQARRPARQRLARATPAGAPGASSRQATPPPRPSQPSPLGNTDLIDPWSQQ
jgi:serine/threonine-protein kinase